MKLVNLFFLFIIALSMLTGCGGGSSSDGAAQSPPNFVGIYAGRETLNLFPSTNPGATQSESRDTTVTVAQNAQVSIRSVNTSNGSITTGTAQLRQNNTFVIEADARTQFSGSCESGLLILEGSISATVVNAVYRSVNLLCGSIPFTFSGELNATK